MAKKIKLPWKKEKTEDVAATKNVASMFDSKHGIIFHSDYYEDSRGYVCSILAYFHQEGATDNFGAFWGVNRIPSGLPNDVSVTCIEQVTRMSEGWLASHQTRAENIANMNIQENANAGETSGTMKAVNTSRDLIEVGQELQNGAAYLQCDYRLLVKAPTLEKLDNALAAIDRLYVDRFGTLSVSAYHGMQYEEMRTLLRPLNDKHGKKFFYTSTEYAGSYSLVTHGMEDKHGQYVGYMVGDVNNSAVLFDINKYSHHIVIADKYQDADTRIYHADKWASKVSQATLLSGHKVVHVILDDCNLDDLNPPFENFTFKLDLNHGDINMFEVFSADNDELSAFPAHLQKLVLMAEQAYETTENDRSIIRGSLEDVATKYYVEQGMWRYNAVENKDALRVLNIPHDQIPRLEMFVSYLDTEYKAMVNSDHRDDEKLHALSVLSITFHNLLSNNGDLFNTITSDQIDNVCSGRRIIYDFSSLMRRGMGIAMAQLVNSIGYACAVVGNGDTIIFHGAENINPKVIDYIDLQLKLLYHRGGRVAFVYNDIESMMKFQDFNHFETADYCIYSTMSANEVKKYQDKLGENIPADLLKLIETKSDERNYIRRGFDNIVFHADLGM